MSGDLTFAGFLGYLHLLSARCKCDSCTSRRSEPYYGNNCKQTISSHVDLFL